jgi:cytochrome c oxidase cbb3-type subunit 3
MRESAEQRRVTAGSQYARWGLCALALLAFLGAGFGVWMHARLVASELLRTDPTQILKNPSLLRDAIRIAQPMYRRHCATCHGSALQGDSSRGVPDLAKNVWLYGNDPVEVEHTIYYGIRSGHPKARNVTNMPALVRTGQITPGDDRDVVEYLQGLAGQPHDETAALRGRSIYFNKGNCYDCHASDAKGATDYGTPALTGPVYLYGGDRNTLYQSILNGRQGKCPAWVNKLTPVQIRALTLYLVSAPRAIIHRN